MTTTSVSIGSSSRRQLSLMQRPLLGSQQLHPKAPLQNMVLVSEFGAVVDPERLAESFATVVRASDVLRTLIVDGEAGFEVSVGAGLPRKTSNIELRRDELADWATKRAAMVLDLATCCYDSVIITHEDQSVSWYLNLHHTITDATSSALVVAATAAVYDGSTLEVPAYYDWSDSLDLSDKRPRQAVEHWQKREPAPRIGRLYQARPVMGSSQTDGPTVDNARSTRLTSVDQDLIDYVRAGLKGPFRSLNDELAWTTLLMSALAIYLHKVTRSETFAIGLPVHNRSDAETKALIGPVMEVFPVDIQIEADDTFESVHRRVGKSIMKTMANAVPGTAPNADYEAIVNVILRAGIDRFGSVPLTTTWIDAGAIDSEHLVRLQLTSYSDAESGLTLQADVNHSVANKTQRDRFWGHFETVLRSMIDEPRAEVAGLEILTAEETKVLAGWETSREEPVVDIVERLRLSLASSTACALQDGTGRWSGAQLWNKVTVGAAYLQSQGVGVGDRVAIEMPRTAQTVVAILAVLLRGAAYVPIDPNQPAQRRNDLAARANCKLVLTEPLPTDDTCVSEPFTTHDQAGDDDEAYVLFTSGSTGEPKGVPITRSALSRYIGFAESRYRVATYEPPVVALFSSLTFDLTVTSLFLPLVAGGKLIVIEDDGPAALAAVAERTEINWCKATPSHVEVLARMLPVDHQLQTYVVGGEAFSSALARRLFDHNPNAAIYNEYGPTEAVVGCMIHQVTPDEVEAAAEVPIGRPAPGVTLRIVDSGLQRVPVGSPGELLIAHPGLTTGYLRSSTTGLESDPFVELDGQRFYRSGDLVRLIDDSKAVYLGRIDEQIKVGGIRLEPTEVEAALETHPGIRRAAVRLWQPKLQAVETYCKRCGLPSNVPGSSFDSDQICMTCHEYERVSPLAESWFKTPADLVERRNEARQRRRGSHDALLLLSGGKDSTFALYKLVELGFTPYAFTLDNGFISEGAKENVRRSVNDLGVDHEFATSETMNAVFRESLTQFSNVCHGCYKTIYSLATRRAAELGIPMIVTGLSRGQLFETRLIPQQFDERRFDPDAIDRAVIEARKSYHRSDDKINRLLDTSVFDDDDVFDQIEYVDIYRYLDVELEEMLDYLGTQAPWVRPDDTGRSTNCLVNAAGIFTHQQEQGFHNYAEPYAWDVRLGHKTRAEAMDELNDELDLEEVSSMLSTIGYEPRDRSILTAWLETNDGVTVTPAELNGHLSELLPVHAMPSAFVAVPALPTTVNGKLDLDSLPAPERLHRAGPAIFVAPSSELERAVVSVWERVLRVQPIGSSDDFFVLGGDSLAALETASVLEQELGRRVDDAAVFMYPTPQRLAEAIEQSSEGEGAGGSVAAEVGPAQLDGNNEPVLSEPEQGILYDEAIGEVGVKYNLGRRYDFDGPVDPDALERALQQVVRRHQPLHWTYGSPRRLLSAEETVEVLIADSSDLERGSRGSDPSSPSLDDYISDFHRRPFDLTNGPLVRCLVHSSGRASVVVLAFHHVAADSQTFDIIWGELSDVMAGETLADLTSTYSNEMARMQNTYVSDDADRTFWLETATEVPAAISTVAPREPQPDGLIRKAASVSVQDLTKNRRGSGSVLTATAAGLALSRFTTDVERPVGLGFLASTRDGRAATGLAGYFLNTLPIQLQLKSTSSVGESIEQVRSELGLALAHRRYPFARIVQDRRMTSAATKPFEVLVAYDRLDSVSTVGTDGRVVRARQQVLHNGTAVGPVSLFVEVGEDGVEVAIEFSGLTMSADDAETLLRCFDVMLSAVATGDVEMVNGDVTVPSPSLLVGSEQPEQDSVWSAVRDRMAAKASTVAIECGGQTLTWADVDVQSSAIAQRLSGAGVVSGDRVAVALGRSTSILPAIVAIARLGATYVPIDATYPAVRQRNLAVGSNASVALVDASSELTSLTACDIDVASIDHASIGHASNEHASNELASSIEPVAWNDQAFAADHLAYIIFTSGSTGEPKGIPVTNRQLAASTAARFEFYAELDAPELGVNTGASAGVSTSASAPTRFLMLSSISFDSSIAGLFWTASSGATLVLPTDSEVRDVDALVRIFAERSISHTLLVPTLYERLLGRSSTAPGWPDHVIVAGEACSPRLVSLHASLKPASSLTNEYGPSEATVWCSAAVVHQPLTGTGSKAGLDGFKVEVDKVEVDTVSIGGPIAGVSLGVVDHDLRLVPAGVEGQLVVGGAGVVDGYLSSPTSSPSNKAFVSVPWADRAFLTGDLAVQKNGVVEFLGRVDDQLSLNGVRIEPGEIESTLVGIAGIDAAAVCVVDLRTIDDLLSDVGENDVDQNDLRASMKAAAAADDPKAELRRRLLAVSGTARSTLVAHLELSGGSILDLSTVRHRLAESLTKTTMPQRFVVQEQLPRLPNGKIDRVALASLPVADVGGEASVVDRVGHEVSGLLIEEVAKIFASVVGHSDFDVDESFFDIGGHSLMAVELVDKIEGSYEMKLPISALYQNPSATDVAEYLSAQGMDEADKRALPTKPDGGVGENRSTSYLVPIQPEGSKTPIVGVHVLGTNSAFYRPLSERLGTDQPIYGVGQQVVDLDTTIPSEVVEIAAEYRRELEPITSAGPIILAAVSLGSVVAFELATQLRREGREVEKLVLFDAAGPMQLAGSDSQTSGRFRRLVDKAEAHTKELVKHPPKYLVDRSKMVAMKVNRRREMASIAARQRLGIGLSDELEIRRFIEANIQSQLHYDFEPLPVPILVFKADDTFTAARRAGVFGWEPVAAAGATLIDVSGGHLSMLAEPYVEELAEHCERELGAESVSSKLIDALHRGDFIRVLRKLSSTSLEDDADARLVGHVMSETKKIADSVRESQQTLVSALAGAGLDIIAQPVSQQCLYHTFTLSAGGSASDDVLRTIWAICGETGFSPQRSGSEQDWLAVVAASSPTVFVSDDAYATRAVIHIEDSSRISSETAELSPVAGEADLGIFVGTPSSLVSGVLDAVGVGQDDVLVDIGSGDGRVVIEAAARFGCRSLGVEQSIGLVEMASRRIEEAGLGDLVEVVHGDARDFDLSSATVIFVFLPPEASAGVLVDLLARRAEGATIVAHEQLPVVWPVEPTERRLIVDGGVTVAYFWR